jgi:hypothetical protein
MMAAELIGAILDSDRCANLPPEIRRQSEKMMHDPRALDALVNHLMRIPQDAEPPRVPPGASSTDVEFVKGLVGEWGRRLEERARGGGQ